MGALYGQAHVDKVMRMRSDLLRMVTDLGRKLPPNTLDQLIDELGGPEKVSLSLSLAGPPSPLS